METLPKDPLTKIALELSPPDLINFCSVSRKNNICSSENKDFWRLKIQRDYPKVFNYYKRRGIVLVNPKNTYIRKFMEVSVIIENFIAENFKHLNNDQKNELFRKLYKIYHTNDINLEYKTFGSVIKEYVLNEEDRDIIMTNLMIKLVNIDKMYNY